MSNKFLVKAFIYLSTIAVMLIPVLFITSAFESDCTVSTILQIEMKMQFSKTELASVRAGKGICPTLYFFRRDGSSTDECIIGSDDLFRGPEISIGGCG